MRQSLAKYYNYWWIWNVYLYRSSLSQCGSSGSTLECSKTSRHTLPETPGWDLLNRGFFKTEIFWLRPPHPIASHYQREPHRYTVASCWGNKQGNNFNTQGLIISVLWRILFTSWEDSVTCINLYSLGFVKMTELELSDGLILYRSGAFQNLNMKKCKQSKWNFT